MNDHERAQLAARLAAPPPKPASSGAASKCCAALVREMLPEITAARAAGKTFKEISDDLSSLFTVSPDAVAQAYRRLKPKAARSSKKMRPASVREAKASRKDVTTEPQPVAEADERARFFAALRPRTDTLFDLEEGS